MKYKIWNSKKNWILAEERIRPTAFWTSKGIKTYLIPIWHQLFVNPNYQKVIDVACLLGIMEKFNKGEAEPEPEVWYEAKQVSSLYRIEISNLWQIVKYTKDKFGEIKSNVIMNCYSEEETNLRLNQIYP